jgi:pyruvate kinase
VSKHRPPVPILAVTPLPRTLRQLSLLWGVEPLRAERAASEDDLIARALAAAKTGGHVRKGDIVVITSGRLGVTATTSHLRVHLVD